MRENRWDMLMQIILIKLALYLTEKCQNNHHSISWQIPVKVKKYPPQIRQFQSVPVASTVGPCPTIIGLLLYRRNCNCADSNHTDSEETD